MVLDEIDLNCGKCVGGRLGVSAGLVRCDGCGEPAPEEHPLAAMTRAPAPPARDFPEPGPIEHEATLAGRVLRLEQRLAALESRRKG
jgi:hypothetical protein